MARTSATSRLLGLFLIFVSVVLLALVAFHRGSRADGRVPDDKSSGETTPGTPKDLLSYAELPAIHVTVTNPAALAVDSDGNIYVGGRTIAALNPAGKQQAASARFENPVTALAVVGAEMVFAACRNEVRILQRQGDRLESRGVWATLDEGAVISSIAAGSGCVVVADSLARSAWIYNLEGERVGQLRSSDANGFTTPDLLMDVAIAPDATIWVANPGRHRLESFDRKGNPGRMWGAASTTLEGFAGRSNPAHFAILADGSFITAETSVVRIKVYRPNGTLDAVVAEPDAFAANARDLDLAVDRAGRIFILDTKANAIRIFSRTPAETHPK